MFNNVLSSNVLYSNTVSNNIISNNSMSILLFLLVSLLLLLLLLLLSLFLLIIVVVIVVTNVVLVKQSLYFLTSSITILHRVPKGLVPSTQISKSFDPIPYYSVHLRQEFQTVLVQQNPVPFFQANPFNSYNITQNFPRISYLQLIL